MKSCWLQPQGQRAGRERGKPAETPGQRNANLGTEGGSLKMFLSGVASRRLLISHRFQGFEFPTHQIINAHSHEITLKKQHDIVGKAHSCALRKGIQPCFYTEQQKPWFLYLKIGPKGCPPPACLTGLLPGSK